MRSGYQDDDIRKELDVSMALTGTRNVLEINKAILRSA